jgi:tyrosyl-tRNA synthetase
MSSWPAGWAQKEPGDDAIAAALSAPPTPPNDKPAKKDKAPAKKAAKAPDAPAADPADVERRVNLLMAVGEECQTAGELKKLVTARPDAFRLYDGFEPSGRMHIAQGVFKAMNVNRCTAAGGTFVFWVADWFALMNDKMGGDLAKIKDVGLYLVEVWRAAGMDMKNVEFRWASDEICGNAKTYWPQMLDVARRFTVARVKKCCTIMGRGEAGLSAAQILYPLMQCTDVFFLRADICQLGVDQRKVNMLARDYCDACRRKNKPVILSHHMLYGLKAGQAKMSKSDPDSAIFMEDSSEDVARKLGNAYCPREADASVAHNTEMQLEKDDLKNPCLDYCKHARRGVDAAAPGQRALLDAAAPGKRALLDARRGSAHDPMRRYGCSSSTRAEA